MIRSSQKERRSCQNEKYRRDNKNSQTGKNISQEELGKKLFVTKQAVSKWENGRTLPDIETIRKLTDILSIPHEEILGETVMQAKKYRSWLKAIIPITVIIFCLMLFFAFDGMGYIQKRMQSSLAIAVLYENGTAVNVSDYKITGIADIKAGENGYSFGIDYGEIKGIITTSRNEEITFGFINTNNWHNVQIHINIDLKSEPKIVTQTVVYKTDNDIVSVTDTKAVIYGNKADVFKDGL